jgi:hypothetical protein
VNSRSFAVAIIRFGASALRRDQRIGGPKGAACGGQLLKAI